MKKRTDTQNLPLNDHQDPMKTPRSGLERRQDDGDGFTYVSTVGWICRREKMRRQTDDKNKS